MRIVSILITLLVCYNLASAQPYFVTQTDFSKADSVAALYPKHDLKNLKLLSDKLTLPFSNEEEKFRAIYKWVSTNISYDYKLNQQNQREREKLMDAGEREAWNKKMAKRVFTMLLEKHRTVCTGYAYLVSELAAFAGISCVIVDGYGRTAQSNIGGSGTANHSWNVVQLMGKPYVCDPTWSSGAYDQEKKEYLMAYRDEYFLPDPELFVRSHYPLDTTKMLLNNKPSLDVFLNGPLIYVNAFTWRMSEFYPDKFYNTARKGEKFSFRFRSNVPQPVAEVTLVIKKNSSVDNVVLDALPDTSGSWRIDHTFNSRGLYVVNILLNGQYVVTYEVDVK